MLLENHERTLQKTSVLLYSKLPKYVRIICIMSFENLTSEFAANQAQPQRLFRFGKL